MFRWALNKLKQLWTYIYGLAKSGQAPAAIIACASVLAIIALSASFFITPKPWYVQFSLSIVGIVGGGLTGVILGLIIGGIGIVLLGTGIGIAGWIAFGIFGSTIGGFLGLIGSFLVNPAAYTFHIFRFAVVLTVAIFIAYKVYKLIMWLFLQLKSKFS